MENDPILSVPARSYRKLIGLTQSNGSYITRASDVPWALGRRTDPKVPPRPMEVDAFECIARVGGGVEVGHSDG